MTEQPFNLTPQNKANLFAKIDRLDPHVEWQVIIRKKKSKRSLDQNRRYWKLLTLFGKQLGYTADEMHDLCRFKFLRSRIEIEGEPLPLMQSSTKLTTAEMADYQDNIERWANQLGIVFNELSE
jgi:hypothetical protein